MAVPTEIDVAIPTYNSGDVLKGTLDSLACAERNCDSRIVRIIVIDNQSEDDTEAIVSERTNTYDWDLDFVSESSNLPQAREMAIDRVTSDWFLFLDDDTRVRETYLRTLTTTAAPTIGAVQGRKSSRTERNTDWVRRRSRRGGTHATLVRREAVDGLSYPDDLAVLEDEYTRRYVEDRGYLWVFNHQARFDHANQDRHPIGWCEGYLGGKYDLSQFHTVALNVPYALLTRRDPGAHLRRTAGWVVGRAVRELSSIGQ
ncbi:MULTISPECIES: glycosyltransferase family A protein [Halostella]|uniref:glycosyltransferase family A protein n=1 Tax=Halostella TaxID=1843185 RepID=UPI00196600F9|nr:MULTISPECIES: glycosyltransferase family A protein [Halostella]